MVLMFEMLKKAFATDPISKDDAYGLIKEFTALLESRIKRTERELHLQVTILSKRIDALEFDLKSNDKKLRFEDKTTGPAIIIDGTEEANTKITNKTNMKKRQTKKMQPPARRGRPRIMAPAAKITQKKVK